MRNNDSTSFFETSDLPLATTLLSLGFPVIEFDGTNPTRVIFRFIQNNLLAETVTKFWEGKLTIEPKLFCAMQRELKSRLRNT